MVEGAMAAVAMAEPVAAPTVAVAMEEEGMVVEAMEEVAQEVRLVVEATVQEAMEVGEMVVVVMEGAVWEVAQ
jgi:hypothetical protein